MRTARTLLLLSSLLVGACGGEAERGEACDEAGGEEGVCAEGSVCGKASDDGDATVCLEICESQDDCAADEACNGVDGTSTKGCRLKEDDDSKK